MFTVTPPAPFTEHGASLVTALASSPTGVSAAGRSALAAVADRPSTGFVLVGVVLLLIVVARWLSRFVVRMTEISALLRVTENLRVARNALSTMVLIACAAVVLVVAMVAGRH
jgi:hypothetical protein